MDSSKPKQKLKTRASSSKPKQKVKRTPSSKQGPARVNVVQASPHTGPQAPTFPGLAEWVDVDITSTGFQALKPYIPNYSEMMHLHEASRESVPRPPSVGTPTLPKQKAKRGRPAKQPARFQCDDCLHLFVTEGNLALHKGRVCTGASSSTSRSTSEVEKFKQSPGTCAHSPRQDDHI